MRISHISWNLIGLGLPLVVAATTVPHLLELLGSQRFGLLTLAWGLIGYAGALDLGIGRAATQRISVLREGHEQSAVQDVLATAVRLTVVTSGIAMLFIAISAWLGVGKLINSSEVAFQEINSAIFLLALALPMQAISATYRGVSEAYLNFRNINILRILLGAANFGLPYLIALYSKRVDLLIGSLVVSRLVALVFFRFFAHECIAEKNNKVKGRYSSAIARQLFQFGGWFTVSSIVSPVMVQADRFFIAALIGASAVTTYVIPYEITVQALIISSAITTVAFPFVSRMLAIDPEVAMKIFKKWTWIIFIIMMLGMTILAAILPKLLAMWLGKPADLESVMAGRILCFGVIANAIGSMYFSLLHAKQKTKETALLHLCELPIFIISLIFFLNEFGVVGASLAWVLRVVFDCLGLVFLSRNIFKKYE